MGFLDISSLSTTYQYVVMIEEKFKQKKHDFWFVNSKQGNGSPKPQNKGPSQGGATQHNSSKPQDKNNTTKKKKDTGNYCEFQRAPLKIQVSVEPSNH